MVFLTVDWQKENHVQVYTLLLRQGLPEAPRDFLGGSHVCIPITDFHGLLSTEGDSTEGMKKVLAITKVAVAVGPGKWAMMSN